MNWLKRWEAEINLEFEVAEAKTMCMCMCVILNLSGLKVKVQETMFSSVVWGTISFWELLTREMLAFVGNFNQMNEL